MSVKKRQKLLRRPRINKELEGIFNFPVFFLISSMGFGKTIAVREFLNNKKNVKTIWLSFPQGTAEDAWMWQKLCRQISNLNPEVGQQMAEYGMPKNGLDIDRIIHFIRDAVKTPIVIVFDDYHENKSKRWDYLVESFIDYDIANLHFVLISRTCPDLPVAELAMKSKVGVLEQGSLMLTEQETSDYFKINNIKLTDQELKQLYQRTDGWTAGTYLALLHYEATGSFEKMESGGKLIKMAVYDKLADDVKKMLLILSRLTRFSLEEAKYITQMPKVKEAIVTLAENNCFVRNDRENGVFVFHAMLKDVLDEEFKASDLDETIIYDRAGKWFQKTNDLPPALLAYCKSNNYREIIKIFRDRYATDLLSFSPSAVIKAFREMDLSIKIEEPIGYLSYIYSYMLTVNLKNGADMLEEIKPYYLQIEDKAKRDRVLGEMAMVESLVAFNDMEKMMDCYKKAYAYFGERGSEIFDSNFIITFGAPWTLFLYHKTLGQMGQTVRLIENEFWIFNNVSNGCGAGYEYLTRAEMEFARGHVLYAEMAAYKAIYKARSNKQHGVVFSASFLLMRIAMYRGKTGELDEIAQQLVQEVERLGNPVLIGCFEFIIGYVYSFTGKREKIPQWLVDGDLSQCKLMVPARDCGYIIVGKIMTEYRDYLRLEVHAEMMLEEYKEHNNIIGIIQAKIFQSVAKSNLYGMEAGLEPLMEGLSIAEKDHYIISFAEEGDSIIPLLEQIDTEFSRQIIPYAREYSASRKLFRKNLPGIVLTKRESDVMDLVAEGYTAGQISETLYISLSTVKKHIASAYGKFGVNKKADAIAKYKSYRKKEKT